MTGAAKKDRLGELDAMRGLAALAVVLFHLTYRFDQLYGHSSAPLFTVPWGKFGVHFFFGISGFVISMTLERTRRPADFVVARFSRLYPAYWAAIVLTTIAVAVGPLQDLRVPLWATAVNFTMLEGFFGVPYVDGVYWTLTLELAFYACMLLIYMAGGLPRLEYLLVPWVCTKWIWWAFPGLPFLAGALLIQHYIPFFAIGICAYRIYARQGNLAVSAALIPFCLFTVAVIDGFAPAAVATLLTLCLVAIAFRKLDWMNWRPLVWLGRISYTLYLLHENIGFTLLYMATKWGVPTNLGIALTLCLCLLIADLTSRLVERPSLAAIRQMWRTRQAKQAPAVPAEIKVSDVKP